LRILLLEDETDIAEAVTGALTADRRTVWWTHDVDEAASIALERGVDLAILDVIVGDDDDAGFRLAEALREGDFRGPVLFTTARDAVEDRVRGLDLGGDDYVVKPYSLVELCARVRALARREATVKSSVVTHGLLRLDTVARRTWWNDAEVELSAREFAMIELLCTHPDRIFAAQELQERVFPDASPGSNVVRVYVHQLRQKLPAEVVVRAPGGYRLGVG